jgi:hypothetical protein
MNTRERFQAVMGFEPGVGTLLWEWGYWGGTIQRWYSEGLPKRHGLRQPAEYGDTVAGPGAAWGSGVLNVQRADDVAEFLGSGCHVGFDQARQTIPLQNFIYPEFDTEVVQEDGEYCLVRDGLGVLSKQRKDGASKPYYVDWPVKDRETWERLKAERLQPDVRLRLPANWPELVEDYKHRDYPLAIGSGYCGFFGSLRALMGEERLFYAYYDQPDLVHDILDYLCDFWIAIYDAVLSDLPPASRPDSAEFWEDMAYRNGPLISPSLFREFMLPRYQRLIGFLRENGVRNFCVDTDGNCWQLIPLFLEAGMTAMLPFEVQAGMDIVEVRRAYPRLQVYGGLDKRALAQSLAAAKPAIEAELAKAEVLLRQGGYIPMADHLIPPDVPWETFVYYRRRLEEMSGRKKGHDCGD